MVFNMVKMRFMAFDDEWNLDIQQTQNRGGCGGGHGISITCILTFNVFNILSINIKCK